MGVSGARKTTLLDVLAGRQTSGYIKGEIKIGGNPKVKEMFARLSGYCEQTDVLSTQITVEESWLSLSADIDPRTKYEFVDEVLETITVELVANPSIIFMDEPTSLDARVAAIVMRAVNNG